MILQLKLIKSIKKKEEREEGCKKGKKMSPSYLSNSFDLGAAFSSMTGGGSGALEGLFSDSGTEMGEALYSI